MIVVEEDKDLTKFALVPLGSVFKFNLKYYIKAKDGSTYLGINLENGLSERFDNDTYVSLRKYAKIITKEDYYDWFRECYRKIKRWDNI